MNKKNTRLHGHVGLNVDIDLKIIPTAQLASDGAVCCWQDFPNTAAECSKPYRNVARSEKRSGQTPRPVPSPTHPCLPYPPKKSTDLHECQEWPGKNWGGQSTPRLSGPLPEIRA